MTDTNTELVQGLVRPDGMPDMYWHDIEEGIRQPEGSVVRRLAQRSYDQWNTTVAAAEQRQTIMTNFNATITKQKRNLEIIAEMLVEEARSRSWCSEYDEFAESVNDRCGEEVLLLCERAYEVTFSVTVTVDARGSDAASEDAESEIESALSRAGFSDYAVQREDCSLAS